MTERCEGCRYWDNSTQSRDAQPDTTGLCRISPPTAAPFTGLAIWPFTSDVDWCACHKPTADLDDEQRF